MGRLFYIKWLLLITFLLWSMLLSSSWHLCCFFCLQGSLLQVSSFLQILLCFCITDDDQFSIPLNKHNRRVSLGRMDYKWIHLFLIFFFMINCWINDQMFNKTTLDPDNQHTWYVTNSKKNSLINDSYFFIALNVFS